MTTARVADGHAPAPVDRAEGQERARARPRTGRCWSWRAQASERRDHDGDGPAADERPRRPQEERGREGRRVEVEHHAHVDVGGEHPGRGQRPRRGAAVPTRRTVRAWMGNTAEATADGLHEEQRDRRIVQAQERRHQEVVEGEVVRERRHPDHGVQQRLAVRHQPLRLVEEGQVARRWRRTSGAARTARTARPRPRRRARASPSAEAASRRRAARRAARRARRRRAGRAGRRSARGRPSSRRRERRRRRPGPDGRALPRTDGPRPPPRPARRPAPRTTSAVAGGSRATSRPAAARPHSAPVADAEPRRGRSARARSRAGSLASRARATCPRAPYPSIMIVPRALPRPGIGQLRQHHPRRGRRHLPPHRRRPRPAGDGGAPAVARHRPRLHRRHPPDPRARRPFARRRVLLQQVGRARAWAAAAPMPREGSARWTSRAGTCSSPASRARTAR